MASTTSTGSCSRLIGRSSRRPGVSDNLISMKEISATEAARGFADLLDDVQQVP
jgi:hypothetical protein